MLTVLCWSEENFILVVFMVYETPSLYSWSQHKLDMPLYVTRKLDAKTPHVAFRPPHGNQTKTHPWLFDCDEAPLFCLSVFQIRKIHVSFPSSTRGLPTFLASKPIASPLGVQPEPFTMGSGSIAWWMVSSAMLSPQEASSNDGSQKRMCGFV